MTEFGCEHCYGDDAETVLNYCVPKGLAETDRLIGRSHFGVSIRRCVQCDQRYAAIFTEYVDYINGEDPQYFNLIPLTLEEASELAAQAENVDLGRLSALGSSRRRLSTDWPSGQEKKTISWKTESFWVDEGE